MKRLVGLLAVLMMLTSLLGSAALANTGPGTINNVTVFFNDRQVFFDQAPVIENGRTLVPFRAIFEAMNYEVTFNDAAQRVTATRGNSRIEMTIGNRTATVNGQSRTLDVAPQIINRRTLVPARFVAEASGATVSWDPVKWQVRINDANWPPRGGTVTNAMLSAPAGIFHPHISSNVYDGHINDAVYDSLWAADDSLTPRASMAEYWTISPDNLSITFFLKRGIKWHDGRDVTLDDVLFSFMGFMHPDYKGPRTTGWDNLVGFDDYRAGRATTVSGLVLNRTENSITFRLKSVYAPFFLQNTGHPIIPKHKFENVPVADWGTPKDPNMAKPIGSGPFLFSEHQTGLFVVLDRNPNYHGGAPYIEKLIWRVVSNDLAVAELQTGRVDYVEDVPANDVASARRIAHLDVRSYPGLTFQYMGMNTKRAPMNDKRVRQAVAWAIDRQAIIDGIMDGHAGLMHSAIHPLYWAYTEPSKTYFPRNLTEARRLLDEAGWRMGNDGFRYKDGKKLSVTLLYPTGNVQRMNTAPVVQAQLKEIGIDVILELTDFATLLTKSNDPHYDFDLVFVGFRLGIEPDPTQIHGAAAIAPGGFNRQQWTTPTSEDLLKKAVSTMNIAERKTIYAQWIEHFQDEIPVLHLYAANVKPAINTRIGNFKPHLINSAWNVSDWYIKR